jgi:hypothetical protein
VPPQWFGSVLVRRPKHASRRHVYHTPCPPKDSKETFRELHSAVILPHQFHIQSCKIACCLGTTKCSQGTQGGLPTYHDLNAVVTSHAACQPRTIGNSQGISRLLSALLRRIRSSPRANPPTIPPRHLESLGNQARKRGRSVRNNG